jgi:hypothetical protein
MPACETTARCCGPHAGMFHQPLVLTGWSSCFSTLRHCQRGIISANIYTKQLVPEILLCSDVLML